MAAVLGLGWLLLVQSSVAASGHIALNGLTTLNGRAAPARVQVTVRETTEGGADCGSFVTSEGGIYEVALLDACDAGMEVVFLLSTGDRSNSAVELEADDGAQIVNIAFEGLSTDVLQALGAAEEEPPPVVAIASDPLLGRDLYVVIGVAFVPAMLLLLAMVLGATPWQRRASKRGTDPDRSDASRPRPNYQSQIEGMILVMVVLAVILLGVTDKIASDGLVSVLAAIVGYTLGRQLRDRTAGSRPGEDEP